MADLWEGPPLQLLLDERSTDTAENADQALHWAKLTGASELLVVSSWWHLRLPVYYRGRRFRHLNVRYARAWRWNGAAGYIRHELRYLPEAWSRST